MAKIEDFIAFRAAIELHKDNGTADKIIKDTYDKCVSSLSLIHISEPTRPY